MEQLKIKNLFNLDETIAKELLEKYEYPWEVLPKIGEYIIELGSKLPLDVYEKRGENIWIAKSASIAPTVELNGPAIIGENTEVRHCAYIRGNALVGNNVVLGNSAELKNVIFFNKAQTSHYNYVGDSIIGYKAHLAGGAITSNLKSDKTNVNVKFGDKKIETGLRKFGAMLGDEVEVGCGTILNPGTIIGKKSNIYPLSSVRGYVNENSIYKKQGEVVEKR